MARQSYGDILAGISDEELSRLDDAEMKAALKQARYSYQRRVQQFARQHVVSYAEIAFEMARGGMKRDKNGQLVRVRVKNKPVEKMNRNQAFHELAQIQHFFQSESATVAGSRRINAEQDKRIFGEIEWRGKKIPTQQMTNYERERFWAAYEEFQTNEISRSYFAAMASETVQQAIGIISIASNEYFPTEEEEKTSDASRTEYIEKILAMAKELNANGSAAVDYYRELAMDGVSSDRLIDIIERGGIS